MEVFKEKLQGSPLPLAYYLGLDKTSSNIMEGRDADNVMIENMNIFQAAGQGALPHVASFLMSGVPVDVKEKGGKQATPLHYASAQGDAFLMRFLVTNGATVDIRTDTTQQTPLMWAVEHGRIDASRELTNHGADLNTLDVNGNSVAFFGVSSPIVLHCLVKKGLKLDGVNTKGQTLLHAAANLSGDSRIPILYLTENSTIDINAQDDEGKTALHYACLRKDVNSVRALCGKGANPSITDKMGFTPVSYKNTPPQITKWVEKFSAETSNTMKERLALPDFSNWGNITKFQIQHFLVAFFFPNFLLIAGSYMPTIIALVTLLMTGMGFMLVAQFGMGQKKRSLATAGWFSGALCFGGGVLVKYVFPIYQQCYPNYHFAIYIWWVATVVMVICYQKAVLADPGVVQSTSESRRAIYESIAEKGESEVIKHGYDVTSMVVKPLRAKHCTKTGQCVHRFDHFCVWTGNAIGGGNHRPFVLYCICEVISQLVVAYTTFTYVIYCGPRHYEVLDNGPHGMTGWLEWLFNDKNILVTLYLVCYNSFVFLFVAGVVVGQSWYVSRNVTSNEAWFPDRYKWMFRLGSRAYSFFDQGFFQNIKDFFWSGNLCLEMHTVPPMNDHLKKVSKKYAEKIRAKQLADQARAEKAMRRGMGGGADRSLESGESANLLPSTYSPTQEEGGSNSSPMFPQNSTDNQSASPLSSVPQFNVQAAISQLPEEKQTEIQLVQRMLHQLINNEEPTTPTHYPEDKQANLLHQARTMYEHYQQAMAMMRANQAAQGSQEGMYSTPTTTGNTPNVESSAGTSSTVLGSGAQVNLEGQVISNRGSNNPASPLNQSPAASERPPKGKSD